MTLCGKWLTLNSCGSGSRDKVCRQNDRLQVRSETGMILSEELVPE